MMMALGFWKPSPVAGLRWQMLVGQEFEKPPEVYHSMGILGPMH